MQFWTHSMIEVFFFRVYKGTESPFGMTIFLALSCQWHLPWTRQWQLQLAFWPEKAKQHLCPLQKAGLRNSLELVSLTDGSHLPPISPVSLAICSCACAYRPCQWRVQSAATNPPIPLAVCLHHAWGYVQKCPLG